MMGDVGDIELPANRANAPARNSSILPIRPDLDLPHGTERDRHPAPEGSGIDRSAGSAERLAILFVAVAAAVVAAVTPGAPTGVHPLDVAFRALLALCCVLAAIRAPWPFLAVASAVAAAGTARSPGVVAAVAVLGLAIAGWRFAGWRGTTASDGSFAGVSLLRAASGAVIADLALRLDWPHITLAPSALAAGAVLLVVVPGILFAPRRLRRWVLGAGAVGLLLAVLLTALAGFSVLRAKSDLTAGLGSARAGLHAAERGNQAGAAIAFSTAQHDFSSANGELAWARASEVIPVVSQQVRAVRTAAGIGADLARAGIVTSGSASLSSLQITDGVFPNSTLRRLGPVFASDLGELDAALAQTGPFRSPWLVAPLKQKLREEVSKLEQARRDAATALMASRQVPGLLGADGTRRYLVLIENPAESRASGGIVGDYAVVTVNHGRMHLDLVNSVGQINARSGGTRTLVGPSDYIARYSHFQPQDNWENVPMSPDFPSVAEVAANLYPQSGGTKVDGVISVDPEAMKGLLGVTGSVSIPGWAGPIGTGNVVSVLGNQEFVKFGSNDSGRIAFLKALIQTVWHDLVSRRLPAPPQMAAAMAPALRGGHLLMWSRVPGEEQFFRRVHLAGAMPPVTGDFVGVVTQNAAGNKLDWYLRRSISYQAVLDRADGQITATLTVRLHNMSPSSGLPAIVIDPSPGATTSPGEDELYVSLYSPWQDTGATLDGRPLVMTDQQELGRLVYSSLVTVPPGGTTTIVLHLEGTWPAGLTQYQLGWYHQPVLFPDTVSSHVRVIG